MSSTQLNFFLNMDDQIALNSKFVDCDEMVFCKYQSCNNEPELVDTTLIENMGSEPLKVIILNRHDVNKIVFRRVEGKNLYSIDILRSPVIEYSRCYLTEDFIRRGRLYFAKDYYDENGLLIEKDSKFVAWAKRVVKEVRVDLAFEKPSNYYGKGADVERLNGKKMVTL